MNMNMMMIIYKEHLLMTTIVAPTQIVATAGLFLNTALFAHYLIRCKYKITYKENEKEDHSDPYYCDYMQELLPRWTCKFAFSN